MDQDQGKPHKYLTLVAISGFIVALDQLTKLYVHTRYLHGESTEVIPGVFNITYVRNYGAAFGILAESPPVFRESFFLLMPPVALVIILIILRSVHQQDRIQIFALAAIFGGAFGNYVDRLKFRYVVDFLELQAPTGAWAFWIRERFGSTWPSEPLPATYSWPAFNLADSAIVFGICTIFGLMIKEWWSSFRDSKPMQT